MSTSIAEPRWYTIGPHGFYDLVRLARRGRSALVRVGYLMALFVTLTVVYYQTHESGSPTWPRNGLKIIGLKARMRDDAINTNARIAERFSIAILVMQNIAVLLLMPIYVASSVHEERDKRTLPMLFTTDLTTREIVQGKWLARVGHVGSILLGGLPVLSFVQLWGGIDMPMIAANFLNTGCWLVSIAAFSMMMATSSRTLLRAVVKTYLFMGGLALLVACCCVPMEFHGELVFLLRPIGGEADNYWYMWMVAGLLGILHLAHADFFLWRAADNLEAQRGDEPMAPDIIDTDFDTVNEKRFQDLPPIPDNAVLWKERYVGQPIWNTLAAFALPFLLCIFLGYLSLVLPFDHRDTSAVHEHFRAVFATIMLVCFGVYALMVTYRLTGCIVGERDLQTLESLLTLPMDRRQLLMAKLQGNLLRDWIWLLPAGISWLILMFLSGWHPGGGVLLLMALAAHFFFFSSVALFLSVICGTRLSAYVSLGVILLMLLIGTVFAGTFFDQSRWLIDGVNPVGCWIACLYYWQASPEAESAMVETAICTNAYALAAIVLALLAFWRFARRPI